MRVKALFILLIIPFFCNAQSVNNLDIKNGFLQFKLGDSVARYQSVIYKPTKFAPHRYEIKAKGNKLIKYTSTVTLIEEHGLISSIEIYLSKDYEMRFMEDAMKKSYGDGDATANAPDTDLQTGAHRTYVIWTGKRVSAMAVKGYVNLSVNDRTLNIVTETIILKKTSDDSAEGSLPSDFIL